MHRAIQSRRAPYYSYRTAILLTFSSDSDFLPRSSQSRPRFGLLMAKLRKTSRFHAPLREDFVERASHHSVTRNRMPLQTSDGHTSRSINTIQMQSNNDEQDTDPCLRSDGALRAESACSAGSTTGSRSISMHDEPSPLR